MDDDIFDDDISFAAAAAFLKPTTNHTASVPSTNGGQSQTPTSGSKVQQPKPQALPARTGPSSILVSPRQKGNPILNNIRALPWEYSDIPADYVLGVTTCALFLSLKYHRLHPEYIYTRIKQLAGKYALRVVLTMVDIPNHEESLKELSKTSLINNVTVILCWSAQEAGRYLELFKSYENAAPTSIRAHQATSYSDKLVEFMTIPRSINKVDAVTLVSSFGSARTAVNARPEEVALVPGWGEKKVQRWTSTVRENFRLQRAAKRGMSRQTTEIGGTPEDSLLSREDTLDEPETPIDDGLAARLGIASSVTRQPLATTHAPSSITIDNAGPDEDEELAMLEASGVVLPPSASSSSTKSDQKRGPELSSGISDALKRLRQE